MSASEDGLGGECVSACVLVWGEALDGTVESELGAAALLVAVFPLSKLTADSGPLRSRRERVARKVTTIQTEP